MSREWVKRQCTCVGGWVGGWVGAGEEGGGGGHALRHAHARPTAGPQPLHPPPPPHPHTHLHHLLKPLGKDPVAHSRRAKRVEPHIGDAQVGAQVYRAHRCQRGAQAAAERVGGWVGVSVCGGVRVCVGGGGVCGQGRGQPCSSGVCPRSSTPASRSTPPPHTHTPDAPPPHARLCPVTMTGAWGWRAARRSTAALMFPPSDDAL